MVAVAILIFGPGKHLVLRSTIENVSHYWPLIFRVDATVGITVGMLFFGKGWGVSFSCEGT